jgi:hypothetical protein
MSRNKLNQIKATQLAHVAETGCCNPYDLTAGAAEAAPARSVVIGVGHAGAVGIDKSYLSHYQGAMEIDLGKIKGEPTLDGKARIKAVLLPTYLDFCGHYIDQGDNYPNDVAVQVMVWLLDAGDIERGLDMALHLVKQGQKMPRWSVRDMPTFLADFFYDWSNEELKAGRSAGPYLDVLVATAENEAWPIHQLCFSKLYAILAKHKERTEDYAEALELCEKAERINPEKAGVKGLKERLQKILTK